MTKQKRTRRAKRTPPTAEHPQVIHDMYHIAQKRSMSNNKLETMTGLSGQTIQACMGGSLTMPNIKSLDLVAKAMKLNIVAVREKEEERPTGHDFLDDAERSIPTIRRPVED